MRDFLQIIDDKDGTILGFQVHREALAEKFDCIMETCERVLKDALHVHTLSARPEWVYITTHKSISHSDLPMTISDPDGHILTASPVIAHLLNLDSEETIGKFVYDLIHPEDHERVQEKHHRMLKNREPVTVEYRAKGTNGYTKILTRAVPIMAEDGHVERLIAYHGHAE